MGLGFSFVQIEAVCADLHRVRSDRRAAFVGALQQLQKQGLLDAKRRPGRGKAGTYSFADLMRFVVALELMQAGMMPQLAARLVNDSWLKLQASIYFHSLPPEDDEASGYLWMIDQPLRDLAKSCGEPQSIGLLALTDLADLWTGTSPDEPSRMLILNGAIITRSAMRAITQLGYATLEELRDDLKAELDARDADIRETIERHKG